MNSTDMVAHLPDTVVSHGKADQMNYCDGGDGGNREFLNRRILPCKNIRKLDLPLQIKQFNHIRFYEIKRYAETGYLSKHILFTPSFVCYAMKGKTG